MRLKKGSISKDSFSLSLGQTLFRKGESICLMGENGSGKSSLLRLLAGLDLNSSIQVEKASGIPLGQVSFIAQNEALFPHLTLRENIYYNHKLLTKSTFEEYFASEKLFAKYPHELSRGQEQFAIFARLFLNPKTFILLDEAFKHLDEEKKRIVFTQLKQLKKTHSLIFSTHNPDDFFQLADRLIILKDGRLIQDSKRNSFLREFPSPDAASFFGKNFSFSNYLEANAFIKEIQQDHESNYTVFLEDIELCPYNANLLSFPLVEKTKLKQDFSYRIKVSDHKAIEVLSKENFHEEQRLSLKIKTKDIIEFRK